MASRIDPSVAQFFAQTVGAKTLEPTPPAPARPAASGLDPALVRKITENVPMFSHMESSLVQTVLAHGEVQRHAAGSRVFAEGDVGRSCYVMLKGAVEVHKQHGTSSTVVATLGVGECFGEMALVRDDVRTASVVAQGDCVTLRLDRAAIDANVTGAAAVYRNIAAILAHRLQLQTAQQSSAVAADKGTP